VDRVGISFRVAGFLREGVLVVKIAEDEGYLINYVVALDKAKEKCIFSPK
jgi:hypothetical protein